MDDWISHAGERGPQLAVSLPPEGLCIGASEWSGINAIRVLQKQLRGLILPTRTRSRIQVYARGSSLESYANLKLGERGREKISEVE